MPANTVHHWRSPGSSGHLPTSSALSYTTHARHSRWRASLIFNRERALAHPASRTHLVAQCITALRDLISRMPQPASRQHLADTSPGHRYKTIHRGHKGASWACSPHAEHPIVMHATNHFHSPPRT